MSDWQPMDSAPRDGTEILVRRHNDVCFEHYVVWWWDDPQYPWRAEHTAYPHDRLDGWHEIPGGDHQTTPPKEG